MTFSDAKSLKAAKREYPGAAVIVKVIGGYAVFATVTDYQTWRGQR